MKKFSTPLFLAGLFFVFGVFTLSNYGINWDTPYRMLRGQAFWHFLSSGQTDYEADGDRLSPILFQPGEYVTRFDFLAGEGSEPAKLPQSVRLNQEFLKMQHESGKRLAFYRHNAWNGKYFLSHDDPGHPPLPEILGAALSGFGYQRLGVIDELSAYKIISLLGSAAGVLVVGIWVLQITGSKAASTIASLALAAWPIFWAESHFNFKDPVQSSLYAATIWALWRWVKVNRLRWWGITTLFASLAMSVKWNIVFTPLILVPWFWTIRKTAKFRQWFQPIKLTGLGLLSLILLVGSIAAIWPRSRADPVGWIAQVAGFYRSLGISPNHLQPDGWFLLGGLNFYPSILLFSQTPEIILLLVIIGIASTIRTQNSLKTTTLLLLWIGIGLFRSMLPWVKSYSGMRQIMEVLPPLAILSGLGVHTIIQKLNLKVKACFLFLISCFLFYPVLRLHPNQNLYFNRLVGGIRGAADLNLIDLMVSYGNVYKQGVDWLNATAGPDAKLAILDGYMFAASPLWMREDISLSPYHFSGLDQEGEYFMLLRRPNNQAVFAQRYPERFLRPIHEIKVDGVSFLRIYKNEPEFVLSEWKTEQSLTDWRQRRIHTAQGDIVDIDLGTLRRVTRIAVETSPECESRLMSPFVDELIEFISPSDSGMKKSVYGINERRKVGDKIEFWFPGESTRNIAVHLQSSTSCFAKGETIRVTALVEE